MIVAFRDGGLPCIYVLLPHFNYDQKNKQKMRETEVCISTV